MFPIIFSNAGLGGGYFLSVIYCKGGVGREMGSIFLCPIILGKGVIVGGIFLSIIFSKGVMGGKRGEYISCQRFSAMAGWVGDIIF